MAVGRQFENFGIRYSTVSISPPALRTHLSIKVRPRTGYEGQEGGVEV